MKIAFNSINFQASEYPVKYFYRNSMVNFQGDRFEKQKQEMRTLDEAYNNLMARQKREVENKGVTNAQRIDLARQISCLTSQYAELNEILNNSDVKNLEKDERNLLNYLIGLQNIGKNKGFNRIVGYDNVKDMLTSEFIVKTMAKARTSQKTDVPNAFLFFGPTGCGKTTFANALAEQTLSFVDTVDLANLSEGEAMCSILDKAQTARQNYIKSGDEKKRTILIVNEFDSIANKYSPIVDELVDFMQNCADEYKCTLFLTSNHPLDIDPRILDSKITPKKFAIPPADYSVAKAIAEKRLEMYGRKINGIDSFIGTLFSNPDLLYSNANIATIIDKVVKSTEFPTVDDYILVAREQVVPSISRKKLERFEKEKSILQNQ